MNVVKVDEKSPELGEYVEAEELVKKKMAKRLTNPLEIIWKSFGIVFFAVSTSYPRYANISKLQHAFRLIYLALWRSLF
ncbi:hypothetical protein IFM89_028111 [Coptis chinensis]|uniref:Uncharacterized protein n=1 Tax=Coptis chinensis TaxID=261450 RepID=A0A835HVA8_9MAGN|nr:hypothetical protein IFM89_028111 [Coptis chinensis]